MTKNRNNGKNDQIVQKNNVKLNGEHFLSSYSEFQMTPGKALRVGNLTQSLGTKSDDYFALLALFSEFLLEPIVGQFLQISDLEDFCEFGFLD